MSEQKIKACIEIKMRDWAAFEDLANELGYEMKLSAVEATAAPTQRRHFRVTRDLVRRVLAYTKKHPEAAIGTVREELRIPHSNATVSRIRNNEFDSLLAGS